MSEANGRPSQVRRALTVVVAGLAFGVTGAFAVASAQDEAPVRACAPTESDLLRAALAARQLEGEHPELFAVSPRPADYDDLRLAAEWAARMEHLRPEGC